MTASLAEEFVASLERSLPELLPTTELLDAAARDVTISDGRYRQLLALGLLEIAVPESRDGLGLDHADVAAIWRIGGRRLVPTFVREQALTLIPLLALAARDGQASVWLRDIRAGAATGGGRVLLGARHSRDEVAVWAGPRAAIVAVITAETGDIFDLGGAGLSPRVAIDPGQGLSTLPLAGRKPALTIEGAAVAAIAECAQLAALAEVTGCAERVLEISIEYARVREQFGRPIAQFQAIAHLLADMYVGVEACRSTVARLCAFGSGGPRDDLLAVARFAIPDAARVVCESAIQVHGGTGFTWEYGLHLYYRRVLQIQAEFGGAEEAARAVGSRFLEQTRR